MKILIRFRFILITLVFVMNIGCGGVSSIGTEIQDLSGFSSAGSNNSNDSDDSESYSQNISVTNQFILKDSQSDCDLILIDSNFKIPKQVHMTQIGEYSLRFDDSDGNNVWNSTLKQNKSFSIEKEICDVDGVGSTDETSCQDLECSCQYYSQLGIKDRFECGCVSNHDEESCDLYFEEISSN